MKKYIPFILTATVITFLYLGCIDTTRESFSCHVRNTSTTSGVVFKYPVHVWGSWCWCSLELAPSPQVGIPVDTALRWVEGSKQWKVRRAIDGVLVDSGYVSVHCEKWLLIEENNGEWSCTWSDEPWE